jgi:hypothetical protein
MKSIRLHCARERCYRGSGLDLLSSSVVQDRDTISLFEAGFGPPLLLELLPTDGQAPKWVIYPTRCPHLFTVLYFEV